MPSKRYHHGNLKAALVDGAVDLIAERGFSMAALSGDHSSQSLT